MNWWEEFRRLNPREMGVWPWSAKLFVLVSMFIFVMVIAAGFSGHGFKFCSVVGEVLADLALDDGTDWNIGLFRLDRFGARTSGLGARASGVESTIRRCACEYMYSSSVPG